MRFSKYFLIIFLSCFGIFNYANAAKVGFTPVSVNVNESTGVQTIQVRLDSPIIVSDPEYPEPHLVIGLVSDDPSRVTVSTSAVNYNATDWSLVKTFTITPVNNGIVDGDATVHINASVISGSEYYDGFDTSLTVTVFDDDIAPPEPNRSSRTRVIGYLPKNHRSEILHPVLHLDQTGPEVKILQQLLNKKGVLVSIIGDGSIGSETEYFGMKTLQAVKIFQKMNGLDADGIVGVKTWELLNK